MRLQKCLTFGFTSYVGWIFISNGGSKPPPYNDKINANNKINPLTPEGISFAVGK